jgi:adenylosuccinate lyase
LKSEAEKKEFKEILLKDKLVSSKLSEKEIDSALDPKNYLGTAIKQAEWCAQA